MPALHIISGRDRDRDRDRRQFCFCCCCCLTNQKVVCNIIVATSPTPSLTPSTAPSLSAPSPVLPSLASRLFCFCIYLSFIASLAISFSGARTCVARLGSLPLPQTCRIPQKTKTTFSSLGIYAAHCACACALRLAKLIGCHLGFCQVKIKNVVNEL